ncbi:hypothetical protein [Streptomyces sp. NBC_00236]|uniref:hypothetical protein n=1 Tax=unclassified Streptomyces TaxID=2593676 RepID=UPI002E2C6121|nr:hypothetical protein [Streptomyces sp. NBC_00236]
MPLSHLTLSSRRGIALTELRLRSTYAGLLAGVPTKQVNDRRIAHLLRTAQEAYPGRPVHLIPPEVTARGRTNHRGEPVEDLPPVACIGAFDSDEIDPAHNSGWYFSALVVVWFQATADPPTDDNAPPGLRSLPWDELARDFED